jgi:carbohydrate kinase (thermoresistant glucokinase family)
MLEQNTLILIITGVSGSGKTTVGKLLAQQLNCPFYEGDDFHPVANIKKMESGHPLNDEDRMPWLESLRQLIEKSIKERQCAVIACSALKESYRKILSDGLSEVRFVYLKASYEQIYPRLISRKGHFMPPELLKSQFETLESPKDAIVVDASQIPKVTAAEIRKDLNL